MSRYLSLFAVFLVAQFVRSSQGEPRPNVLLVMADDQGWGDVAFNGHPVVKTPNLDRLASEGLRFDRFYAAAPVCSPTRGSVMTGRHPNRFGCFSWGHTLRPQEVTLAEALRRVGYRTGHFGKWHLGSVRSGSPVNPGESGFEEWFSSPNFFDFGPVMSLRGRAVQTEGEGSQVVAEAALDFISRCASKEEPFLAVVWFGSPHDPHEASVEDRRPYRSQPEPMQHFYGEIAALDRAIGQLRDGLRSFGVGQNTILWYCSDNGAIPVGSTGGHRGRKGEVYDGGLLVPAVLDWPERVPAPRTTGIRCSTSDIYPTILEIVGAEVERQPVLDGISLLPLIEGRMERRPKPIGFWSYPEPGIRTPSKVWMAELLDAQREGREPEDTGKLWLEAGKLEKQYRLNPMRGHAAWLDGDWKLHQIERAESGTVKYELYHLADDPAESNDLAAAEPDRLRRMAAALEQWRESVVQSLNGADY